MDYSINTNNMELWLATGSQHLYGEETLQKVAHHAALMVEGLHTAQGMPIQIIYKPILTSGQEIYNLCQQANSSKNCAGLICWMHTFSPAKMWINGLKILQKPLLHFHTQFNRDIPWQTIEMDFMNLHQSAHGDREFGFILSRLRLNRKVVVGHWQHPSTVQQIADWARAAMAWNDWQGATFIRFGDNMRNVAVTEGDKVEAELKFGYSVNTFGISYLAAQIAAVKETAITDLCSSYADLYNLTPALQKGNNQHQSLRDAAKIELGIRSFLQQNNAKGFTDTFEDLGDLLQLPGIAAQRLMADGYGFAGEGDWKTTALVRALKVMGNGLAGGNSFMEDYTNHFEPGNEMVLGSHMLEICPSIASQKPNCEIHPLSIGGKQSPVRLVFNVTDGPAINVALMDVGNRFRMVVQGVDTILPKHAFTKLPVARVLWKPQPDMQIGCAAWMLCGGAHHTAFSQNITAPTMADFADIANIECITINTQTTIHQLKNELRWNDVSYQKNHSF